jgi:AcrR family transcriptional regulator
MSQRAFSGGRDRSSETRLRLLEAAGETFAQLGFRDATVRDICKRASANVAAVNYHFGDKERLYVATLEHWITASYQRFPPDGGLGPGEPAVARLRALIRSLLLRLLIDGRASIHGKLLARELFDPTPAFDLQFKTALAPMLQRMEATVGEIGEHKLTDRQLHSATLSIVGQCTFYHHSRPLIARLYPDQGYDSAEIERIADHITDFSIAGINALLKGHHAAVSNGAAATTAASVG